MKLKRLKGKNDNTIEIFNELVHGKNTYFVSKVSKTKIETGQARNKKHAMAWGKRLCD